MSIDKIYKIVPQMKAYHNLGSHWLPYIMFTQRPNFRSNFVNTDSEGFRFNNRADINIGSVFNTIYAKDVSQIVCGGSFGFGTGASEDSKTISSLLTLRGNNTLNFCGSAHVGFQDIISLLSNLHRIKKKNLKRILIFTGINDFFLSQLFGNNYPDTMYFYSSFIKGMNSQVLNFKKKLFYNVLDFVKPGFIDIDQVANLNQKNLIKFFFSSKFRKAFLKSSTNQKFTFEEKLNRNFLIYKMIEKYFEIEVNIFLSPYIFWSKELSKEENDLVAYSKIISKSLNNKIFSILTLDNYNYLKKKFQNFSDINGFKFIDLNHMIKKNSTSSDWLFVDGVHCSDKGYKLVSEMI